MTKFIFNSVEDFKEFVRTSPQVDAEVAYNPRTNELNLFTNGRKIYFLNNAGNLFGKGKRKTDNWVTIGTLQGKKL